jgi:hypothetical protein
MARPKASARKRAALGMGRWIATGGPWKPLAAPERNGYTGQVWLGGPGRFEYNCAGHSGPGSFKISSGPSRGHVHVDWSENFRGFGRWRGSADLHWVMQPSRVTFFGRWWGIGPKGIGDEGDWAGEIEPLGSGRPRAVARARAEPTNRDPAEALVVGQTSFEVLHEQRAHHPSHRARFAPSLHERRHSFE